MSDSPPVTRRTTPTVEHWIERFEEAWQTGNPPAIDDSLGDLTGSERRHLLIELAAIDMEYRWDRGEPVCVEVYWDRYPELQRDHSAREQLIRQEFFLRRRQGLAPSPREWMDRFGEGLPAGANDVPAGHAPSGRGGADTGPTTGEPPESPLVGPVARGVKLGRYRLVEQLGRGGFATVWRAWDPTVGRYVALKIPHWELSAHPDASQRLWREIRIVARINHEAIVPIHEVAHADGRTWIVYQLVDGRSLADVVAGQIPSARQAARWIAKLAEAVATAHDLGVVHRDIKPGNILIDTAGRPRLTDFGLACLADHADRLTQEGDVVGTPAYMAPELAMGFGHRAEAACDIYSLGAVLYELLVGRPPFVGNHASVLRRVVNEDPIAPRRIDASVPTDLETICLKAMAKDPHRRFATAGQLADDLWRWLDHRPITARRIGPLERTILWCRRRPGLAATLSAAVAICLLVATVAFTQVLRERNRFEAQRDQALGHLYQALINEAQSRIRARESGWAQQAMAAIDRARQLPPEYVDLDQLRNVAIECLISPYPSLSVQEEWRPPIGRLTALATTADAQRLALGTADGSVWLQAPGQEALQRFPGHDGPVSCLSFSPEGDRIVSGGRDGALRLWSIEATGKAHGVAECSFADGPIHAVSWSSVGNGVACACDDGTIWWASIQPAADADAGEGIASSEIPMSLLGRHTAAARCVVVLPGGERVASGGDDRQILLHNVATGSLGSNWFVSDPVGTIEATSDGHKLLFAEPASYTFGQIDLTTGRLSHQTPPHRSSVVRLQSADLTGLGSPQPSVDVVISASADGTIRLWNSDSQEIAVAGGSLPAVEHMALARKANQVVAAYADGSLRTWTIWTSSIATRYRIGPSVAFDDLGRLFDGYNRWAHHEVEQRRASRRMAPQATRFVILDEPRQQLALGTDQVTPDGEVQGIVQWCRMQDGQLIREWQVHNSKLAGLHWCPQRRQWLTAGSAGDLALWNDAGELVVRWQAGQTELNALAFEGPSGTIVSCGPGTLRGWTLNAEGQEAASLQWSIDRPTFGSPTLARGGGLVAWAVDETSIELRSTADGTLLRELRGHHALVTALAFSPDGKRLAAATADRMLLVWDVATGQVQHSFGHGGQKNAEAIAWHPSGPWLALCHGPLPTTLWNLEAQQPVARIFNTGDSSAVFSSAGDVLWMGSSVGGARQFSMKLAEPLLWNRSADGASTQGVRFDVADRTVQGGHLDMVWGTAVSPDNRRVATVGHDGATKIWAADDLSLIHSLEPGVDVVWPVAFSPNGRWLATGSSISVAGSDEPTGRIHIWDTQSFQLLACAESHRRLVVSVAFHPREPLLASSSLDGEVRLWDLQPVSAGADHTPIHRPPDSLAGVVIGRFAQHLPQIAFHPSGEYLVGASRNHQVAVWEVRQLIDAVYKNAVVPPPQWIGAHQEAIWAVAFSRDGEWMATGTDLGTITIWRCQDWTMRATLHSVAQRIRSLAFSADGAELAVGTFPPNGLILNLGQLRRELASRELDWD